MDGTVVEYAPFALRPGIDEAALRVASARLQDGFLARQPGWRRRELVAEGDGRYADLVWWDSLADAEKAMAAAGSSEACAAYFALMAFDGEPGAGVRHLRTVAIY
ncbi:MAG: hypothetical protein U1E14_04845 [Geminicoccaceae bacterium]